MTRLHRSGGASAPYPRRARRRPRRRRHHRWIRRELHRFGRQPRQHLQTGTLVIGNSPSTALLTLTGMKPGDDRELDRRHHEHRLAGRRLRAQDGQRDRLLGALGPDAAGRPRLRRLDLHAPPTARPARPRSTPAPSAASQTRRSATTPAASSTATSSRPRFRRAQRHLPGPDGLRRLRLVGHPVLSHREPTAREGPAVSGGRPSRGLLRSRALEEAPMSLSATLPLARRGFGILLTPPRADPRPRRPRAGASSASSATSSPAAR